MTKRWGVTVLAMAACTACATTPAPEAEGGTIAITNVTILPMDGDEDHILRDQTVVIVGRTIREIDEADEVEVGAGATIIDGTDRFLMPGLAEMHAHVPPVANPDRQLLEDYMFLYLANGITTIRGMLGSPYQIDLVHELERGDMLGPTFYAAAPSINGTSAPDPATAERLVREHAAAGYDLQKIHPGVSLATWDRMADVADDLDFSFGGHVPTDVGLEHALRTGMSTVDHLDGYVTAVARGAVSSQINSGQEIDLESLDRSPDAYAHEIHELVELTRDREAYVVPTMYLWENLYRGLSPDSFLALPEMQYVSSQQREAWRRQGSGGPQASPAALEAFFALRNRILKALADGGAGILMGTDSPQLYNVPGFALHREIGFMEAAGMTRYQILASGTRQVREYVDEYLKHRDDDFGTVREGWRADLILTEGNPLEDLRYLQDLAGVMVAGRWIPREELDRGLEEIAARHR